MSAAGIDFETFGRVNLPKCGLDNYIHDPHFRPLLTSIVEHNPDGGSTTTRYDFVTSDNLDQVREEFRFHIMDRPRFIAHHAAFERAVLTRMDIEVPEIDDSAVIARAVGAGSKLEVAGAQLVNAPKLEAGSDLIKKFSMPQENGYVYIDHVDEWTEKDWKDWELFGEYCDRDAELAFSIGLEVVAPSFPREWIYESITHEINDNGWFVDVDLVERMQVQYELNLARVEQEFRRRFDPKGELNFRSTPQLRKWCAERGIKAQSFDELNVQKLYAKLSKRINQVQDSDPYDPRLPGWIEVGVMLKTKQELGGSSLSKLQKILDLVGPDNRLRGQYLHLGAGQTYRTSGRGVQMQNLKRLPPTPNNVNQPLTHWDNDTLAKNIRQVFTAEHPDGQLIVGDYAAIESRGLAYLAGAGWKLQQFREGRDMYKVLAAEMFHQNYETISKSERQAGKVGELSCGYGAGPGAVKDFAEKMGVNLNQDEAAEIVSGWRTVNTEITALWKQLNLMLEKFFDTGIDQHFTVPGLNDRVTISLMERSTPQSLRAQTTHRGPIISAALTVHSPGHTLILHRVFNGIFKDKDDYCYHKPSELKSGKLWHDRWTKNGQSGRYKLYGGKLAGILTQSFCRELFFAGLSAVHTELTDVPNVKIVGQFHDEIVLEWTPPSDAHGATLEQATRLLEREMLGAAHRFGMHELPLDVSVSYDHRYIK